MDTLNVHERNTCVFTDNGFVFALKYLSARKTQKRTSADATNANVKIPAAWCPCPPPGCVVGGGDVVSMTTLRARVYVDAVLALHDGNLVFFFCAQLKFFEPFSSFTKTKPYSITNPKLSVCVFGFRVLVGFSPL